MESGTATRKAIDAGTFAEAFRITAENKPDEVFVRTKGDDVALTWAETRERVDALAGGLAKLGLERGQCIAILLTNRPEFHVVDLAAVTVGATPFSIYMTYSPSQIEYVVSDAEARILVTEQAFLPQVLKARENLPNLEHVILVDGEHEGCLPLSEVEGSNPDFDVEAAAKAVEPDDVLTLIYTSGTTGPPKGVQIAHKNMMSGVRSTESLIQFPEGSRVISWLPAAHIAERAAHHYLPIAYGFQVTCCPDPREVMSYLPEVRPQWFFAVPRIWEKLKSGLETMLAGLPDEQSSIAQECLKEAIEMARLEV
jgi:long-subunit acyl-CoA synthetase (AMP-forming)